MKAVYRIYETSGPDMGVLLGEMAFDGCEPVYRTRGELSWCDLEQWRNWTGRTLSDLRIERIEEKP